MRSWISLAIVIIVVIAVSSAVYSFMKPKTTADKHYGDVTVTKNPGIFGKAYTTEEVEVAKVVVVKKESVKDVPEAVRADKSKQLLASGEVEPYRGTTDVWAALDINSGITTIQAKRRPLPFFAFMNDKEMGVRYGVSFGDSVYTGPSYEMYGRWTFLRVGAVHFAGYAEANQSSTAQMMLEISYRW